MPLQPAYNPSVRIIDIDGTIIAKRKPDKYILGRECEILGDSLKLVKKWYESGDYIVFWTARPKEYRELTMRMLDELGFPYHELLMDKPYCHHIHIYDDNYITTHKVNPKKGLVQDDL